MTDVMRDRLREAVVASIPHQEELISTVVDQLGSAPAKLGFALDLVRLSYRRSVSQVAPVAIEDALRGAGYPLPHQPDQLVAVMATLVLVHRFSREFGKRGFKKLLPETVAADAVIALANQGEEAVHPDLVDFAFHWRARLAQQLRGGHIPGPPPLREVESATPGEAPSSGSDTATTSVAALTEWANSQHEWLQRSGGVPWRASVDEQLSVLWWLEAKRTGGSAEPVGQIIRTCRELRGIATAVPGPVTAFELLERALGEEANETIDVEAVAKAAAAEVPESISDLCVLLNGVTPNGIERALAKDVAFWLFVELELSELAARAETQ